MDKDLQKFNPTVAELTAMVEATKGITVTDLADAKQLEVVKKNRLGLRDARVKIEKIGKELRADAITFQKAVIAKEKELIGIIGPEEDRLSNIEEEAKTIALKKEREMKLPGRKQRIADLGEHFETADEHLLSLDDTQFEAYFNERVATKNERDRTANEAKLEADRKEAERVQAEKDAAAEKVRLEAQAKIDADRAKLEADQRAHDEEKKKLENEKLAREREEKARVDERVRLEQEAKDKKAKEEQDKLDVEKRAAEEKAKLEKQELYKQFRIDCGYTPETKSDFKEENTGTVIILWKKVGQFPLI